jgi:hypothetical protein
MSRGRGGGRAAPDEPGEDADEAGMVDVNGLRVVGVRSIERFGVTEPDDVRCVEPERQQDHAGGARDDDGRVCAELAGE